MLVELSPRISLADVRAMYVHDVLSTHESSTIRLRGEYESSPAGIVSWHDPGAIYFCTTPRA
jgi:hypothetical protein